MCVCVCVCVCVCGLCDYRRTKITCIFGQIVAKLNVFLSSDLIKAVPQKWLDEQNVLIRPLQIWTWFCNMKSDAWKEKMTILDLWETTNCFPKTATRIFVNVTFASILRVSFYFRKKTERRHILLSYSLGGLNRWFLECVCWLKELCLCGAFMYFRRVCSHELNILPNQCLRKVLCFNVAFYNTRKSEYEYTPEFRVVRTECWLLATEMLFGCKA